MRMCFNALVVFVLVASLSCSPRRPPDKYAEIKIQRASIVKEFATLKNAVKSTEVGNPFSYELQLKLPDIKSRPLLIDGDIADICIRNGSVIMEMDDFVGETPAIFRLSLDSNMLSRIKASDLQRDDPVAVVARITSVEKTAMEIKPSGEELDVSIGDRYIVMGACIDFRTLPKLH